MSTDLFGKKRILSVSAQNEILGRLASLPINYVGNKRKLLRKILGLVESRKVKFDSVFDAFSGSGVVSLMFRTMGKKVTANDLLSSSALTAALYLKTGKCPLTQEEAVDVSEDLPEEWDAVAGGRWPKLFAQDEADFLDRVRSNIFRKLVPSGCGIPVGMNADGSERCVPAKEGSSSACPENGEKASYAMLALVNHVLQTCFLGGRYYNGQTLARLDARMKRSGSLTQGLLSELYPADGDLRLFLESLSQLDCPGDVYNCDLVKLLESRRVSADLIYLDPPYGGESSDYASLYEVCETLVRGNNPKEDKAFLEASGRFRGGSEYKKSFDVLLDLCGDFQTWIVSFNESSFATLPEIEKQVARFGRKVESTPVNEYRYNYRKNASGSKESEFLILATKP